MLGERPPDGIDVTSWGAQHEETVRITSITIGLDTAKSVFQVHVEDFEGRTVTRRRLRRSQVAAFLARQAASVVGIEARGSAYYWGRLLRALGREVRLIPAAYVKSEEHTSELQSLMRISYAVFCLIQKKKPIYEYKSYICRT